MRVSTSGGLPTSTGRTWRFASRESRAHWHCRSPRGCFTCISCGPLLDPMSLPFSCFSRPITPMAQRPIWNRAEGAKRAWPTWRACCACRGYVLGCRKRLSSMVAARRPNQAKAGGAILSLWSRMSSLGTRIARKNAHPTTPRARTKDGLSRSMPELHGLLGQRSPGCVAHLAI